MAFQPLRNSRGPEKYTSIGGFPVKFNKLRMVALSSENKASKRNKNFRATETDFKTYTGILFNLPF